MHEVLVNRLGGLSLPRKSVVRLTDRPDMTLDVYRGRKTTIQQQQHVRLPLGEGEGYTSIDCGLMKAVTLVCGSFKVKEITPRILYMLCKYIV